MSDSGEQQTVFEEKPSMERRLVLRLLKHWRHLAGERDYPARMDFVENDMPDIWPHVFVMELGRFRDDPVLVHVGTAFTQPPASMLIHSHVSSIPEKTLISQASAFHPEVVEQKVAINRGGEFTLTSGVTIKFRSILLPLSDNGRDINALLGAANFKEEGGES